MANNDRTDDMQRVTSRDGTAIAYLRSGAGPALLLVHGTVADHSTTWRLVRPELEKRFTVFAMDRRGRGGSGDSPAYELQREAEDVAAVIDSIGEPVNVLGHSYGALCAIEASLLAANLRRLILYEGVPLDGSSRVESDVLDRLQAMLDAGDVQALLPAFLRDVAGASPEQIEQMRADERGWAARLANARTVPRELRTLQRYTFVANRFRRMHSPVLLCIGGDSPRHELEAANGVAAALPDARILNFPGQQHLAMYAAPELFVREVVRFLQA